MANYDVEKVVHVLEFGFFEFLRTFLDKVCKNSFQVSVALSQMSVNFSRNWSYKTFAFAQK